jgi:hypothetical protein
MTKRVATTAIKQRCNYLRLATFWQQLIRVTGANVLVKAWRTRSATPILLQLATIWLTLLTLAADSGDPAILPASSNAEDAFTLLAAAKLASLVVLLAQLRRSGIRQVNASVYLLLNRFDFTRTLLSARTQRHSIIIIVD